MSAAPVVVLDLGGTWMKGAAASAEAGRCGAPSREGRRPNPLAEARDAAEFAAAVADFCRELTGGIAPAAVVAATAGEVDAAGKGYLCAGAHLGVMGTAPWVEALAGLLGCPVTLINDAEAFLLGAAERGLVPADRNVGALVIGTGLGFAMTRLGRWWKPSRRLLHFGGTETPVGDYNYLLSAVRATGDGVFAENGPARSKYIDALLEAVVTATHLFHLDTVLLGGGAVDAARVGGLDLVAAVGEHLERRLLPGYRRPHLIAVEGGNRAILEGGLALAAGNQAAEAARYTKKFGALATERTADGPGIETFPPQEIALRLAQAAAAAAERFCASAPALARGAEAVVAAIRAGGRVVYLGAGTSGRVGALDAVEIPCTYGLAPDRFVAVIAGGVADAGFTIEDQFEEDTSSAGDLILLGLQPRDVVVGISASGTAFFVRSGLAFARARGAKTILIHEAELESDGLADFSIRLESGTELVAGSTRMKAGTATKKALNVLSTTAMILFGKVRGGEMIDLDCCNAKLRERATRILGRLGGLSADEAAAVLARNDYQLRAALEALDGSAAAGR